MRTTKFTVDRITSTPSGTYAVYYNEKGGEVWTGNFGFEKGDIVEMENYDGYAPTKITVNGEVTWTEKDKIAWWERYNSRHKELIESLRAKK